MLQAIAALDVWSRSVVLRSSSTSGRTSYGPGSSRPRHHDRGGSSGNPS
jgi:hypothetical protein